MGYLNNEAETKQAFDSEGFFHTGDAGYLLEDGFLVITGRIKEIIITSGGHNVPPVPIELRIQDMCPIVAHCVIVGDDMKYLSALLTLKVKHNQMSGLPTDELSPDNVLFLVTKLGSQAKTVEQARQDEKIKKYIDKCM